MKRRIFLLALCSLVAVGITRTDLLGYVLVGPKWPTNQVGYLVNPNSVHMSDAATISALQGAAAAWSEQSAANINLVYSGQTNGSSLTLNGKNEVFFRQVASGGLRGETYWWYDGNNNLTEFDVVFYEDDRPFFATSGCIHGLYIDDLAVHEFGHALGLAHTSVAGATMQSRTLSYCDTSYRTLEADDIAGIERAYPPTQTTLPDAPSQLAAAPSTTNATSAIALSWADNANNEDGFKIERSTDGSTFAQIAQTGANSESYTNGGLASGTTYFYRVRAYNGGGNSSGSNTASAQTQTSSTNTAPTVTIANPVNGSSYPANVAISFSGSADDTQDGNLTSGIVWTSSISGQIGTGGSFTKVLPAGSHVITARVTDSGSLSASRQINMTVTTSTTTTAVTLSVRGYKVKGQKTADLSWSGLSSSSVDVFRNGARIATTGNDGSYTDSVDDKGNSAVTYKVCAAGTSTCSNQATTSF